MTTSDPLSVLVVEDEALVAMGLQSLIEDSGHGVAGWATSLEEARRLADANRADLALVDVHLADGPTGPEVAAYLRDKNIPVVFMTANAKRLPEDFAGALGVISKPYTANGVMAALAYLHQGCLAPSPSMCPAGLLLSPDYSSRWSEANRSAR